MSDNPELSTTAPLPPPVGQVPLSDAEKARLLDLNSLDRPLADMERAERDALRLREHPEVPPAPPLPPPLSDAEKVRLHDLGFAGRPLTPNEVAERSALQTQANIAVVEPLAASSPPTEDAIPLEVHYAAIMDGIVAAFLHLANVLPQASPLYRIANEIKATVAKMRQLPIDVAPPPPPYVPPPPPPQPVARPPEPAVYVPPPPVEIVEPNHV